MRENQSILTTKGSSNSTFIFKLLVKVTICKNCLGSASLDGEKIASIWNYLS